MSVYVCTCKCMYVCMNVCLLLYVCMYVCVYVSVHVINKRIAHWYVNKHDVLSLCLVHNEIIISLLY